MFKPLEWLPVAFCIKMKLLSIVHKALHIMVPSFLYSIISHPFSPNIVLNVETLSELCQWELRVGDFV